VAPSIGRDRFAHVGILVRRDVGTVAGTAKAEECIDWSRVPLAVKVASDEPSDVLGERDAEIGRARPGPAVILGRESDLRALRHDGTIITASGSGLVRGYDRAVTYSIVARDDRSGELGVAVQAHYFGVGSLVSWAEAGVGAIATQSVAEPAYGQRGLELMRDGASAPEALHRLLAEDRQERVRQIAFVDRHGRVAAHTGARCIREAGHRVADGVSAQANIMERGTVPDAMVAAYRGAGGDLAERLLVALEAAEGEGGDLRGRQSAALLVVAPRTSGRPTEDRLFDLRVDDHPDPVRELRRLLALSRAYERADLGDELAAAGDVEAALAEYASAYAEQPDNPELAFWHGIALAANGREQEARPLLETAYAESEGWRELLRRLPEAGLFPDDPELIIRMTLSGRQDAAAPHAPPPGQDSTHAPPPGRDPTLAPPPGHDSTLAPPPGGLP
jgi:uncharacterized Ntn-hydrolase superfamily protein